MLRLAWRSLRHHRVRLALTVVTVALGIAFIAGTNIFTASLRAAFDSLLTQPRADVSIAAQGPTTLSDSLVSSAAALPGAASATGLATADGTYVLDPAGKVVGSTGAPARGRSWVNDPAISPLALVAGRAPSGPGEVALLSTTAERARAAIGDSVRIDTPLRGVQAFTVVGLVDRGISGGLGGTLAVFDLSTAQQVLTGPGTVSAILLRARAGVSQDDLAAQAASIAPRSATVETGQQSADQVAQRIRDGFAFFGTFLLAFGVIALFVSTFLIFNTFSMIVLQRARELAFLRAVGASRGQVTRLVLLEAAFIGLAAAVLGLVGGIGVSLVLRWALARLGADLPAAPLTIEPSAAVIALVAGLTVTLVAALVPARRAGQVPPVVAMRASASVPPRSLRRVTVAGVILVLASAVPVAWGLSVSETDAERAAIGIGMGAILAIVGVVALTPALARPVLWVVARLLRGHVVPRLAALNAMRNPRRTAATASALTVGLALMTAVSVIGASARASVESVVDSTIGADFIIVSPSFTPFSPEVFQQVQGTPGTDVVTFVRTIPVTVGERKLPVTGIDPAVIESVLAIPVTAGSVADLALGSALVDVDTASALGLVPGSTARGDFVNGEGALRIVGLYEAVGPVRGFLTTLPTLATIGSLTKDTAIYISLAPGASPDAVRGDLLQRLSAFPSLKVQDQSDIKQEISGQFDVIFGLVYALLGLSVLVAFLGIVNTLSLSVVERTRELGMLRAIGASRRQVRRLVRWEALLLAALGTLLGLALGLAFGALLQRVLAPQGIEELVVPTGQLVVFAALSMVGGLAAAAWPAWRASRLPVLAAIARE